MDGAPVPDVVPFSEVRNGGDGVAFLHDGVVEGGGGEVVVVFLEGVEGVEVLGEVRGVLVYFFEQGGGFEEEDASVPEAPGLDKVLGDIVAGFLHEPFYVVDAAVEFFAGIDVAVPGLHLIRLYAERDEVVVEVFFDGFEFLEELVVEDLVAGKDEDGFVAVYFFDAEGGKQDGGSGVASAGLRQNVVLQH